MMEKKLFFNLRPLVKALMVIAFLLFAIIINPQSAAAQTYDCSNITDVLEGDCEALVAFYDATDGQNWTNDTNWLTTDTVCNWYGIQCWDHGAFKSVYGIYLENNQVGGSLPPEMGGFFDLQWLDLNNNHISGPIPTQLPSSNLRGLDLSNNQLTGAIPAEFGVSVRLYYLVLDNNQLSGPIPAELGSMGSLTTFYLLGLSNNDLSGPIPAELGNLTDLEELMLEDNQLSGSIPSTFGNLANLDGLYLQNNQLSGNLPAELGDLTTIKYLNLNNNQLEGSLPDAWGGMGDLVELKIQQNPLLSGPIPTSFTNLSALTSFYFNDTGVCIPAFYEVQYWVDHVDDVIGTGQYCFYEPFCDVVDQTPQTECEALVALYNTTGGDAWTNHDDWLTVNRPCLWHGVSCDSNYHITQVNLSNNNLVGSIPQAITDLIYLRALNLPNNQLSGGMPTAFGSLIYLQTLNLSNNQLTGAMPHFGDTNDLQMLDLSHNQFLGLSTSIEFLTDVTLFDLSYNQIVELPSLVGSMSSLQTLRLEHNILSGTIPAELGNLSNLQELSLNDNSLHGSIPATLGNLSNLQLLYLQNNALDGPIPPELENLNNLQDLNLASNELDGTLPSEFESLLNLVNFAVGDNPDLSGPIPLNYTNLANLDLFHFHGTGICEPDDPTFQTWLNAIPDLYSSNIMCPNTFAGPEAIVSPIDATTGTTPVTLTFLDVPEDGYTSLETSESGPPPPTGFQLPDPGVYFELGTTVTYTPPIEICIDYSGYSVSDEANLMIWHYDWGLNEWVELTDVTLRDTTNDILCAYAGSLSPFALFEPALDPLEQIEAVSAQVQALIDSGSLNKGQGKALLSKLENAYKQLSRGKINPAIRMLEAFINQVEAFKRAGILTPYEADPLIDNVTLILTILRAR
jgi:Leucine-rich repeat (LRR) protein